MKNILIILLLSFTTMSANFAQDFEGEITYKLAYKNLPEEMGIYKAMLPKSSKLIIKNHMSKMQQNMSAFIKMDIVSNAKTDYILIMVNALGKKIAYEPDVEEMKQGVYSVELKDDIKVIEGYKCNKAVIKDTADNLITYWYTKDLPSYNNSNLPNVDIEGFPMEYIVKQNGMTVRATVSKIDKKSIDDSEFELKKGYEKKTKEEIEEMMGRMKF